MRYYFVVNNKRSDQVHLSLKNMCMRNVTAENVYRVRNTQCVSLILIVLMTKHDVIEIPFFFFPWTRNMYRVFSCSCGGRSILI